MSTLRSRGQRRWVLYAPIITWTVVVSYLAIGAGLTLQPDRFSNTPSYHNLLVLAAAQYWGGGYILVAALLMAWRMSSHTRWLGVFAHMVAIILTGWWLLAFVIRYGTDDGTTIVNVVSWSVFLSLVARSALGIDAYETH